MEVNKQEPVAINISTRSRKRQKPAYQLVVTATARAHHITSHRSAAAAGAASPGKINKKPARAACPGAVHARPARHGTARHSLPTHTKNDAPARHVIVIPSDFCQLLCPMPRAHHGYIRTLPIPLSSRTQTTRLCKANQRQLPTPRVPS